MVLLHRNHRLAEISQKNIFSPRFAYYITIIFGSAIANSGPNAITFTIISVIICSVAEFFYQQNNKNLFYILMIDRFFVVSVYFDTQLYSLFPNEKLLIYEILLYIYNINLIYYALATHFVFIYYVTRNKSIHWVIPVTASIIVYTLFYFNPELQIPGLTFIYAFGMLAVILYAIIAHEIYEVYSHRRLALIGIYFIYSLFICVDYVNTYNQIYEAMNLNFIYPIVLFLASGVVVGNERFVQSLIKGSFILLIIIISAITLLLSPENSSAIIQHVSFIVFASLMAKVVHDYRKVFLNKI